MARYIRNDDTVKLVVATTATFPGELRLAEDLRVGIVTNLKPVAVGDTCTLKMKGQIEVLAGAALTAGDVASLVLSSQTVIATGGAGVDSGLVTYDVADAALATVDLNELPAP